MIRPRGAPVPFGMQLHTATLRCASLLVPRPERAGWLREWTSELWYVYRAAAGANAGACTAAGVRAANLADAAVVRSRWRGQLAVMAFCRGAFRDALCLKTSASASGELSEQSVPPSRPARRCLATLALIAASSAAAAFLSPAVRAALSPVPYRDPHALVMISHGTYPGAETPTVRVEEYRSWRTRSQHVFTEFALYHRASMVLQERPDKDANHNRPRTLQIASTSPNLFSFLGVPLSLRPAASPEEAKAPALVLARSTWQKRFHGDPAVFGTMLKLGGREVRVAGVLEDSAWQLPGRVDAWILEPDADAAVLPATTRVFVLARAAPIGRTAHGESWQMAIADRSVNPDINPYAPSASLYECVSFSAIKRVPLRIFLITALLALLALPATTSLPLGDYPPSSHALPRGHRMRRWTFLACKLALCLPIVFFVPLDLTALVGLAGESIRFDPQSLQILATFSLCLFGLRWALRDQRARCPVCLCKLTHPARVGEASRNFLAWNGTELICTGGHGLLHVPEMPTCWFPTQRWTHLDPSWRVLFAAPVA